MSIFKNGSSAGEMGRPQYLGPWKKCRGQLLVSSEVTFLPWHTGNFPGFLSCQDRVTISGL